jgi:phosphohistidine phosphatase
VSSPGSGKRIYLLRHAKSSWDDAELPDHDRPLAPRGRKAAKAMAAHLEQEGIRPALVLCSSATRARETLERVAAALGDELRVEIEPRLYGATEDALLVRLRELPDELPSVMLIGHNPGLQDLALLLSASGGERAHVAEKLPTGALVTLIAPVAAWAALEPGLAQLVDLVLPRELG